MSSGFEMRVVYCRASKVGREVAARAEALAEGVREHVAETARENVAVDTGETRDSIHVEGDSVVAGGAALFLEGGTIHMAAEPFLGPAVDDGKRMLDAGMRRLI